MEPKDGGRSARQRRGNGAAGWVASGGGGLPDMPPVAVASEAELRTELERLAGLLAPAVEWSKRVEALIRLEGLAKGGASGFASFPELLLTLRDALAAQMQERRSAVSRQACHAVGELAAACGISFEPLALHLLPVVFKTLAMGIQVVSEMADACAHAMVAHCPSQRLLPRLCAVVSGDRNGRLRHSAAEYLLHALEAWPPGECERQLEAVERAVLAAAQDAQAETRLVGRSMYGALACTWPAQAHALLARLERDRQLQEKLVQAAQEYVPGVLPKGTSSSHPASRRSSLGNSGAATPRDGLPRTASMPAAFNGLGQQGGGSLRLAAAVPKQSGLGGGGDSGRGSPTHPAHSGGSLSARQHPSNPSTARENHSDNWSGGAPAAAVPCTPRSVFPKSLARREAAAAAAAAAAEGEGEGEPSRHLGAAAAGRERVALRRSLGGAALRMSTATFRRPEPGEVPDGLGSQSGAAATSAAQRGMGLQRPAVRVPLQPPEPTDAQEHLDRAQPSRPLAAGRPPTAPEDQPGGLPDGSENGSQAGSLLAFEPAALPPASASLPAALAGLGKAGLAWTDRVELYHSLQSAMEQAAASQAAVADMASSADRLVAALLDGCGDAHFRVAAAALAALAAGLAGPGSRVFEPQLDRVLTTLFSRMTDSKEQLRQLVGTALAAVLLQHSAEATVAALARSLHAIRAPKIKCATLEFIAAALSSGPGNADGQQQQPALLLQQLTGAALTGLLRALVRLATDKNADIRRAAAKAVAAAHHAGEAQAVAAAVQALPPADAMIAQRAIRPAMQHHCGDAGSSLSPSCPARRAASTASSQPGSLAGQRRHSTDGPKQLPAQQEQQQRRPQSGSSSRSERSSQSGWSPARARKQQGAAAAAAQNPADPSAQHTPEPPSPFVWRVQSASLLPAAAVAAEPAAAGQAAGLVCPAPQEPSTAAATLQQAAPGAAACLAPFDDVMAGQLQRLLVQLEQGPSSEALQGLSRMAHVLPMAAWQPCFEQITAALCMALDTRSSVVQDAGLMATRDLAAVVQPSLFLPALPALLPRLLACAAQQGAAELALAADEALQQLLQRAPPQSCLGLLLPQLPAAGSQLSVDRHAGAMLHATIHSLRRVVSRMQPAGLAAHLQPLLVPGLCAAYSSPMSDVRKATVDCLVAIWQVVGDVLEPHLAPLSASQRKLLDIYIDKACGSVGH